MHILFIDHYSHSSFAASVYHKESMVTGKSVTSYKEAVEFCRAWLMINPKVKSYKVFVSVEQDEDNFQIADIWDDDSVLQGLLQI
jgi:hypothetical protein